MRATWWLLAAALAVRPCWPEDGANRLTPLYSSASIVNSASGLPFALAPNTIATIYGENLAWATRSITPNDVQNGILPTVLAGTGVHVLIQNIPAYPLYVSPTQMNFIIPNHLLPGRVHLQLVRDGVAGRQVDLTLRPAAPALFQLNAETVVANRPDGSVLTRDSPARPGEIVVLWATGLGETKPNPAPGRLPMDAAPITRLSEFQIYLDGVPIPSDRIDYAGVAPGFAGLYQINFWLPEAVGADPEIRLALGGDISPPDIGLPVQP